MEIYDAKSDRDFGRGYIDIDEMRTRKPDNGIELKFRYMHGGFEGTNVRFSFCFPEKERYEGRFYQYLSPFPGPEEELASLPVTGLDDKIAFCITHGAYYVESNMGSAAVFGTNEDPYITHKSSAQAAEFSRIKAQEVYGYAHRPYGYVYGGSGGGYRTIACIENTNAFDGAAPFVIGSPYAIPNCQTTRAHAERILRDKISLIMEAVDAGGNGNPYAGLDNEEADALREVTLFGYPLKSWFASEGMNDGSLSVLAPAVKQIDPGYFEDFWKVPGYLGADKHGSAVRDRICMDTIVKLEYVPGKKAQLLEGKAEDGIDVRNGVNDAWKKMISSAGQDTDPWLELETVPQPPEGHSLYLQGLFMTVLTGKAAGKRVQVGAVEDRRIYLKDGFGTDNIADTLQLLEVGDEVHLDNSDYIAIQTYHRHQVPGSDYLAWDQFRDREGNPLYPQRPLLLGPMISGNGTGVQQNGMVNGKVIICAALMDEQAYPWQPDWYRRKIAAVHGEDAEKYCRLWYFDNVLHDDSSRSEYELYATTYVAGLRQALLDLAAWVEKGTEPLMSTCYKIHVGEVIVPDSASERGGLQAVPHLTVNGARCVRVKAGEEVRFRVEAEVPSAAGILTAVEWSFEGETDFVRKGEWELFDKGQCGVAETAHVYANPGTYFGVVRVESERNGNRDEIFTQIRNIDRVRVIVEKNID